MNKISTIIFKDLEIEHITKSSLKNSYISVKDSKVILKTPKVSKIYIDKLLFDKERWIRKQILEQESRESKEINLEDEVLLFGDIYSIDSDEVKFLRESLEKLKEPNREKILRYYDKFYKVKSMEYLTPRLNHFSNLMGLEYKELKFRKMRSRWGSCSSKATITLNSELMKVKKELIDYVLVHELVHLKYMNHSKQFHSLVEKYLYNSSSLRKELKGVSL